MGVICRGWYRDTASAPGVHVTQLISELLKTVGCEVVVVVQHVIMGRSTCSLRKRPVIYKNNNNNNNDDNDHLK